ncbi:MAG TPA: hypothetical protein DCE56_11355 [Cyanobacteria bacterium UBA8553]|nr:hypothetical protein [Cyanobacteria bacterium UBA8553]HAJ64805.1 hypothetical protein [Cyanobacteria bacterium UBA8543]
MEESAKSDTESSVWFTELTDTEMEAITGGLLTNDVLDGWLTAYKNGTLQTITVAARLQRESRSPDSLTNTAVIGLWFYNLPPEDKRTVVGAVASAIVDFAASYLRLT